ncbi:cell wall metabolism sensor histidine kinase WalK [Williamsia sp. CHRR-6]|uniref:sensor histidine kinase n=1 Tax=Williamsia sp. CHRR-6 TaxID=2835871 RepID=UPI001BD9B83D|nr:HAMP domain-containing sensor histidine kinase [Williamsia sp. CHRR-6]MBT0567084.1 HAMP domain-containing histidine kinase [Williamsia sp. CHRR-6]
MIGREKIGLQTHSLRLRVTVIGSVIITAVIAVVIVTAGTLFTVAAKRDVNSLLNERATYSRQLARTVARPEAFIARIDGQSVRAQLVLSDGSVVGKALPPNATESRRTITLRGGRAWARGAQLTLAVDNRLLDRVRGRLLWGLVIAGAIAVLVAAGLLWIAVRYALAPLDAMTALARSIATGRRGARLTPQRRDTELGRTAAAFDAMLDSLEGAEHNERAAQQAVRRFVADAGHELRTPISGVQAIAETLLQAPPDMPAQEREQLCLLLVQETRRAGRLVDDMVDMARIDSGIAITPAPTDVGALAAEQVARVRLLYPQLTIEVHGAAAPIAVDASRISQIVANLVDNACQATPPGGSVRVSVVDEPHAVSLLVSDTGPGVAPADRERIFERLVRLDDARDRRTGGSGLGLAVARGLARAHGGDLTCLDSTGPSSGAVFCLWLPR